MRAILTGVVATIEAIAVALASLLVVAGLAFLVWWLAFDLAAEPGDVFSGAGAVWLLAHLVPLSLTVPAETMQLLGFAPEALTFVLSLAPLGITCVTVGFAIRSGWRFGGRGGAGAAGVLGGAIGFGAVAALVRVGVDYAIPGVLLTALTAALVYGVSSGAAFLVRAAREEHPWWVSCLGLFEVGLAQARVPSPAAFPYRAGQVLRLAAILLSGYVGLSALGMAAAFVGRFTHVIAASEALQLDLWGTILMFVVQLALLPVLLLWAGSWVTGAGFTVGAGSSASPFGQLLGPMPGVPILAAIPEGWGSAAVVAPLLLALFGLAVGIALRDTAKRQSLMSLVLQVVCAALLTGLAVALGNALASGSLGPGRLSVVGPDVWVGAGLAAAELGVGVLLGAFAARADLARRVAAVPAEMATRLGFGAHDSEASATEGDSGAAVTGTDSPGAADAWSAADAHDPVDEWGTARSRDAGPYDQDEYETVPVRPLDAAESLEPLAPVTPLLPRNETTSEPEVRAETDELPEGDPAWETETVEQPDLPLGPEPELFDQHETHPHDSDDTPDGGRVAPEVEADAGAPAPEPVDPDAGLDAEALIEAYSWDHVDETPAPDPGVAPGKWRWPRRKG